MLSKLVLNDIGRSLTVFHEMLHAFYNQSNKGLTDDNHQQHEYMTTIEELKKMQNFLTIANEDNNWGLSKDEIIDLSFFGLTKTKNFMLYLGEKAGLPEGWMDEKDPVKIDEYKKI